MQLYDVTKSQASNDLELLQRCLPLVPGSTVMELGCGTATTTRALAAARLEVQFIGTEVDEIQHARNLEAAPVANLAFVRGGAESIPAEDASLDAVIMLKSLHHVPVDLMPRAFVELQRVLRPQGRLYVSEPVAQGPFNDILRLFHDEEVVRRRAFEAVHEAAASAHFELLDEIYFHEERAFESFAAYEADVMDVTHTEFHLDDDILRRVRQAYDDAADPQGRTRFDAPHRVDLLQRT